MEMLAKGMHTRDTLDQRNKLSGGLDVIDDILNDEIKEMMYPKEEGEESVDE